MAPRGHGSGDQLVAPLSQSTASEWNDTVSSMTLYVVLLQDPATERPYRAIGPFESRARAIECREREAKTNSGWAELMELTGEDDSK